MSSRRVVRLVMTLFIAAELLITVALTWVVAASTGRIFDAGKLPPGPRTALVLGSLVVDGEPGDYVRGRLDTTVELWQRAIVHRIILSGNGSPEAGNEPAVMRGYLVGRGVPTEAIVEDPAGVDTAASCQRARDVYELDSVLIVTQDFHLDRAIALCRAYGVDATGVPARCDCPTWTVARNHVRELVLANPRALLSALASAVATS